MCLSTFVSFFHQKVVNSCLLQQSLRPILEQHYSAEDEGGVAVNADDEGGVAANADDDGKSV